MWLLSQVGLRLGMLRSAIGSFIPVLGLSLMLSPLVLLLVSRPSFDIASFLALFLSFLSHCLSLLLHGLLLVLVHQLHFLLVLFSLLLELLILLLPLFVLFFYRFITFFRWLVVMLLFSLSSFVILPVLSLF